MKSVRLLLAAAYLSCCTEEGRAQLVPGVQLRTAYALNELLSSDSVLQELKVTEAQKVKVREIRGEVTELADLRDFFRLVPARRAEEEKRRSTKVADLRGRLAKVLAPEQDTRLQQLTLQRMLLTNGYGVLLDDGVLTKLTLSMHQERAIRELVASAEQRINDAAQAGESLLLRDAREIKAGIGGDCLMILTEEQRKEFQAMIGKPFDVRSLDSNLGALPGPPTKDG
jgi:hypothetical protein